MSTEAAPALTFRVVLNQTDPVYVYSGEGDSCSRGMLQVINPYVHPASLFFAAETDAFRPSEGGGSLEEFKRAAENATTTTPSTDEPVGGQRILTIDVGKDGESFSPSDARDQSPGTIVQFHFHPKVTSTPSHPFRENVALSSAEQLSCPGFVRQAMPSQRQRLRKRLHTHRLVIGRSGLLRRAQ